MKSPSLLSFIFLSSLTYSSFAQEYSYTHYDVTDGLAGSVVYCITQDKDGFIWTGTETGVSRFDGTHFKTFTAADGLPDIEVLEMFGDSKGKVWMAPFRKSVCYYYQGHIHNQDNDSLLRKVHLKENVENFAEDAEGNILILEANALHWFGADGTIREIDSLAGYPVRNAMAISRSVSGHFLAEADGRVFALSQKEAFPVYSFSIRTSISPFLWMGSAGMVWRADTGITRIHSFLTAKSVALPFAYAQYKQVNFGGIGDSLYYFNEINGSREYNLNTGATRLYLPGKAVSMTFRDATGNTWFTTLGHGIYRLNSDEFRTIRMKTATRDEASIYAITRVGDLLLAGDNDNEAFSFSLPDLKTRSRNKMVGNSLKDRILSLQPLTRTTVLVGSDSYVDIVRLGHGPDRKFLDQGVKAIFRKNNNEFLLSTAWGVRLLDLAKFRTTDTLWSERSTTVYCRNDTVYIGTLNGLYRLDPDRSSIFLGRKIPFLAKRISSIAGSADGTLWIASYDAGLIGYRDGRVVAAIDKQKGLTSNICRTTLIHDNVLWVGTDKGLNRIALDKTGYPVTRYTSNDGLASDLINCIYVDGNVVYAGTPAGLSYFDQTRVDVSQGCRLHLLSILNSGTDRIGDSAHLLIPYQDKHIRLEFAAISYRSVGDIEYRYRMLGLDSTWQETKESFLEYPILPSGKYIFQLQAINKFGIGSRLLSMPIEVDAPFWLTLWFDALLIATFLALVWVFVALWIKRLRRRQEEHERLSQRMAELENTALQAQMNPHFIFNCLNSIQQYVFEHEVLEANKYLTGFARLIRATLHNSTRTFISLADEIDYLSTYLSLEKLRFKDKMDYSIETDPDVDKELFVLPPMLIQPFVENCMRHGLRHKNEGKGFISVRFETSRDKLSVVVEDNGIGRGKAAGYKTREHIEYQSTGMSLTADRIRIMNIKYADSMQIEVIDLEDGMGRPTGTRVVLKFPLFHHIGQTELI